MALQKGPEPYMLALLMPEYWKPFIRNGPIEQVGSIAANRLMLGLGLCVQWAPTHGGTVPASGGVCSAGGSAQGL